MPLGLSRWLTQLLPARRRARAEIDQRINDLSSTSANAEEITTLHLAKLALEEEPELRLRSLQTLIALRRPEVIPFLVYELVRATQEWPRRGFRQPHLELLSEMFLEILSWRSDNENESNSPRFRELPKGLERELHELRGHTLRLGFDLYELAWLLEVGADVSAARIQRPLPVRLFVSGPTPYELKQKLERGLDEFLRSEGFERIEELPGEEGSWWKRFIFKTKSALTHEQLRTRLKKTEHALEATYLDKPQAEANNQQAQGAASLIAALNETDNACIQVGTLLLVKASTGDGRSAIVARTLTPEELKRLEQNQSILKQPDRILELLEGGGDKDKTT